MDFRTVYWKAECNCGLLEEFAINERDAEQKLREHLENRCKGYKTGGTISKQLEVIVFDEKTGLK